MSSIQERLQLKRVPLDTWNVREQLCLASAVVQSGDQNWMSVSRALKTIGEPNRPPDWYSQKSCAAQYGVLLEHVETPKRKKRCSEGAGVVETPQESIVKRLTQDRIVEIQKTIAEMNQQYDLLKNEITEVRNHATNEDRLREIWTRIETAKRARERENARRAACMKEREERRARVDRTWRPPQPSTPTSPVVPTTPSSPLLTSLLKSSPVVTTPQHMPHPASVVDTMSPSVTAPTLSMLLEKGSPQHENKHAAIEHIKSQLVQIEQQLANASPPAAPPPAVDIDDIEIKEEDVYVFRDVDLHLPHKQPAPRVVEQPPILQELPIEVDSIHPSPPPPEETKVEHEEPMIIEQVDQEVTVDVDVESESLDDTVAEEPLPEVAPPPAPAPPPPIMTSLVPEVKFPTTEIKVIQPQQKIKEEEPKEPEVKLEESQPEPEVEELVVQEEETVDVVEEKISEEPPLPPPQPIEQPVEQPEKPQPPVEQPIEQPELPIEEPVQETEITQEDPQDIPLPPEPQPEVPEPPLPPEPEVETPQPEPEPEPKAEVKEEPPEVEEAETSNVDVTSVEEIIEDLKKDDDSEDSMPLKQMIKESLRNEPPLEETHTETDDDTPMEVSREEEKDGKKRRDYSRKKKPDSRTCSGSESAAEASAPDSPHASDAERRRRLWKKSVMLVYSRLCAHKYASIFLRPISDEEAPGYSACVRRPMDLGTIRRNIDNGQIRSTAEFQRDVLLMLSNALLYNSSEHSVYAMAREMQEEAQSQLGILLAAQAHAGLEAPPRRKRRRHDEPRPPHKRTN